MSVWICLVCASLLSCSRRIRLARWSHSVAPGDMPAINVMLTLPDSETPEN